MIRAALAAAATLAGITNVSAYYRQSLRAGDGFVRWSRRTPDDSGFGWVHTYEVWLALPSQETAAEKWIETNLDQLLAAIGTVTVVTAAEPATLVLGQASVNGLIIRTAIAN